MRRTIIAATTAFTTLAGPVFAEEVQKGTGIEVKVTTPEQAKERAEACDKIMVSSDRSFETATKKLDCMIHGKVASTQGTGIEVHVPTDQEKAFRASCERDFKNAKIVTPQGQRPADESVKTAFMVNCVLAKQQERIQTELMQDIGNNKGTPVPAAKP